MIGLIGRRSQFSPPPSQLERQLVPVLSVMIASLTPLIPQIAISPLLPPLGFMTLLAWRLLRNDLWPVWAALPLGLFDDMFSGQPLGSAMALWTMVFLAIELIDSRLVWRDHLQNWGIAAVAIVGELVAALGIANLTGGGTSLKVIVPQIVLAVLLFPLVARLCAVLDRWRFAR